MARRRTRSPARMRPSQAELRASVFTVIQEHERGSGVYLDNPKVTELKQSAEGKLMLAVVRDFLEFAQLDYSLSVFDSEAGLVADDASDALAAAGMAAPPSASVLHGLVAGGNGSDA